MRSFRTIIPFMMIGLFLIITSRSFADDQRLNQSPRERAMKAAQQMRDYRNNLAATAEKNRRMSTSAIKTEVAIKVDRSIQSSSTIYLYDNMESGANGWTSVAYSGNDLWHQTTSTSSSKPTSWWNGIDEQGFYATGQRIDDALISPAINLTSAVAPVQLLFTESFVTEQGWDYCMVDISIDGGTTWNHLRGGYGDAPSGNSEGWIISSLDLSAYAGNMVNLRFYFDTGDSIYNEFPGWFVDDVLIFDQGGMITGRKYYDENQNGFKEYNEHGLKEWLITATGGQISLTTRTNVWGKYWLPVPLGTYTVTEELQDGWTQTGPPGGQWVIDVATPDTIIDSVRFGNWRQASSISGMMYNDLNQNGEYDAGDTALPFWKILLTDTLGNEVDFDRTDSLGFYKLFVLESGKYLVKEIEKKGWVQNSPVSEYYTIEIPDLMQDILSKDFSNYWSPTTNGIMGIKFADRNRNHLLDEGEENLAGVQIKLYRKGNGINYNLAKQRITDSSGYYQFLSLEPDTYKVVEIPPEGWWQSYPESCYVVDLTQIGTFDNTDFGNYEIDYSSLGGMKFNDLNGDGIKDQGDDGLNGWTIALSGTSVYGKTVTRTAETAGSGNYTIPELWPGQYVVSEVFRSNWRQTYPANLQPHFLTLGPEVTLTGIEFGNTLDSSFSLSFRTFLPEELANAVNQKLKHLAILSKPDKQEYSITLYNDTTLPAHSLLVHATGVMDIASLTCSKPGPIQFTDLKNKKIQIIFDEYVQPGDSVVLHGFTKRIGIQHASYQKWLLAGGGVWIGHHEIFVNIPRYPMPNAINFLSAGAGTRLKVGLGGPHSALHLTYKDVLKSLYDKHGQHIGDPRCLGTYSGVKPRPIKKQIKYLPPTKHNNKLFAEAIAFQANINGSDYGILPGGFGNLIFDSGENNDCDGLTLRQIAARLDSMMSMYDDLTFVCTYPGTTSFTDIYQTIRKIDSAFSGPIDTLQFAGGLHLKAVKPLSDAPFLRLDSSFIQMGTFAFKPIPELIPERFALLQNYPNPFNPSTTIEFYLPYQSFVTLQIYNALGQEVATLLNREELSDGPQDIELSAVSTNLATGVYYYRLVAETIGNEESPDGQKFISTKKMLLIK